MSDLPQTFSNEKTSYPTFLRMAISTFTASTSSFVMFALAEWKTIQNNGNWKDLQLGRSQCGHGESGHLRHAFHCWHLFCLFVYNPENLRHAFQNNDMGRLKKARFLCRLSEEKSTVLLNLAECSFSKNRTNGVPTTNYLDIVVLTRGLIVPIPTFFPPKGTGGYAANNWLDVKHFFEAFIVMFEGRGGYQGV